MALAHPFDDGNAGVLERSPQAAAASLGSDGQAWRRLVEPFVADADVLLRETLGPLRPPRHPLLLARFGRLALRSAVGLATSRFSEPRAQAFFAGISAHSMLPLRKPPTASFGLMLAILGHAVGWPIARGGSAAIVDALASYLRSLEGEIRTAAPVASLRDLPPASVVLFDVAPRKLVAIAGDRLPSRYRRKLERFRYGPGVFNDRLGARRPDSLEGARVRPRRNGSSRRDARGDRRLRGGGLAG